ncbi:MAG: hypothetical protein MUE69_06795 [Myxococcota bacterium]|nr:hypothetical protein [Myxococcota bacterium]
MATEVVDEPEGVAAVEMLAEHHATVTEDGRAPEVSPDPSCAPEVGRAVDVARAALIERGAVEAALTRCTVAVTRCDAEPNEERDDAAIAVDCRVRVRTGNERIEVRFEPGPVAGAPDHAEAWLSSDLREVGRTWIGGSTYGVARGGALVVRGVTSDRHHTHGGEAAEVAHAAFVVHNATGRGGLLCELRRRTDVHRAGRVHGRDAGLRRAGGLLRR